MSLEKHMNAILEKMQIPLKVIRRPSSTSKEHARIILEERLLVLSDKNERDAWHSLFHECLEYRLRSIVSPYREIINKLIEAIEQITYKEKEKVLDQILSDFWTWTELEHHVSPTANGKGQYKRGNN